MKNFINGSAFLLLLISSGCMKTLYTNKQVLDGYKTKNDVTKIFGLPAEKKISQTSEEYLYVFDGRRIKDQYKNVATVEVKEFNPYERYVIFLFDKDGNVVNRKFKGVDFKEQAPAPGKTVALVLGLSAVVTLFIIAAASSIDFDSGFGTGFY